LGRRDRLLNPKLAPAALVDAGCGACHSYVALFFLGLLSPASDSALPEQVLFKNRDAGTVTIAYSSFIPDWVCDPPITPKRVAPQSSSESYA
jgi:hypothetical protein